MESIFVRNARTGVLMAPGTVPFVRVPNVGEHVQWGTAMLSVVVVIHTWNAQKQPIAEIRLSPPGARAFAEAEAPSSIDGFEPI